MKYFFNFVTADVENCDLDTLKKACLLLILLYSLLLHEHTLNSVHIFILRQTLTLTQAQDGTDETGHSYLNLEYIAFFRQLK